MPWLGGDRMDAFRRHGRAANLSSLPLSGHADVPRIVAHGEAVSALRTTDQIRKAWGSPCDESKLVTRTFVPGVQVRFDRRCVEAVQALASVFQAHGYAVRQADTGGYNCRNIAGAAQGSKSLHAYGLALDINWNTNPILPDRLVTDFPPALLQDVRRIATKKGVRVWALGADWKRPVDAMHFQVNASPAELAAGMDWDTVRQHQTDPAQPASWPVLQEGDTGPTVTLLQRYLGMPDGLPARFGPKTLATVLEFQRSRKLKVDGIVGASTWTHLLAQVPGLAPEDPSPVKLPPEAREPNPAPEAIVPENTPETDEAAELSIPLPQNATVIVQPPQTLPTVPPYLDPVMVKETAELAQMLDVTGDVVRRVAIGIAPRVLERLVPDANVRKAIIAGMRAVADALDGTP